MIKNIKEFFDKNLFNRIFSGILFIVPFVFFIIKGDYYFIIYFLIILSILIDEFINVVVDKVTLIKKIFFSFFLIISIFHFIFLRLSYDEYIIFYILYIVFAIWVFDSFSLIGGKIIGGKKLLPVISPNKTFSGFISGFTFLLIYSITFMYIFRKIDYSIIILTILIGIIAFIGDTLESYLKRFLNIKDFGNIMPGHGGLLDRMDAFLMIFIIHFLLMSFNINFIEFYA
ncbi:phosphatidate cytidylyltransferase [Pelagibacteraceae bacterium]|jgi:phosphatidate cytidylyltransferase|nr:phosphatidate cytidylyltransferase [Pelagibacteraceae bacterium]